MSVKFSASPNNVWLPGIQGKPESLIFGEDVPYDHETVLMCDKFGIHARQVEKNKPCNCGRIIEKKDFVFTKGDTCLHYEFFGDEK